MKNILYVITGLIIVVFSNTILNGINLSFFSIRPNLTLIYLTYLSIYIGINRASIIGLILGLIIDITVGKYFGLYSLLFFLLGLVYGSIKDKVFKENILTIIILVALATLVENVLSLLIVGFGMNNIFIHVFRILESIVANVIISAGLFYPINYLINKVEEQWWKIWSWILKEDFS